MQSDDKQTNPVKSGFAALSLNCRDAVRLQSEAMNTRLCPSKRLGLWLHLLICKWCRRYGRQIRFLGCAANERPEDLANEVSQTLSAEARERIKHRLQSEK